MSDFGRLSRRRFVQGTAALLATGPLVGRAAESASSGLKGRMYKTLKRGMVQAPGTLTEKFRAVKAAGFDGVEMDSPGMDVDATKKAIAESGLPVDGTVCSTHWTYHHTDPDPKVRARALADLEKALRDTHAVGGHSVLLVVGHGQDGPEKEIWARSVENIAKAVPLAAKLGCYIAIENVWNQFLYDDGGPDNQTADKFVQYVDQFNSPWVGMQYDIGNHWKYGDPAAWIRTLGKRIVKLDVKGFSRKTGKFTKIGEGDIVWADVRQALLDIKYAGWVAAEVGGGGVDRLREINANMDREFGLG
jgi:L-ribulose-5-phosphate 3-epimerase